MERIGRVICVIFCKWVNTYKGSLQGFTAAINNPAATIPLISSDWRHIRLTTDIEMRGVTDHLVLELLDNSANSIISTSRTVEGYVSYQYGNSLASHSADKDYLMDGSQLLLSWLASDGTAKVSGAYSHLELDINYMADNYMCLTVKYYYKSGYGTTISEQFITFNADAALQHLKTVRLKTRSNTGRVGLTGSYTLS